jgi:hypothetical protein
MEDAARWIDTSPLSRADVDDAYLSKGRGSPIMRRSAHATTAAARKWLVECDASEASQARLTPLRQSALPANSARAQGIVTMENADVDAIIVGLANVVCAYCRDTAQKRRNWLLL